MKLIFVTNGGNQFEIEVGDFDTLLEIKEKVQNYHGIPISKQTLYFNGNILLDDIDLLYIINGSLIYLHIADDAVQTSRPPPQDIMVMLNMPAPFVTGNVFVNLNETIQQLKELIQGMTRTPTGRIVIKHQNGMELPDHLTLLECQILVHLAVTVEFRPPPPKMNLEFKMPGSNVVIVETCVEDTVLQLKEKIHQKQGTPIGRIAIMDASGNSLPDHKTLQDCAISLESGITVEFLPESTSASSSSSQPAPPPTPRNQMSVVLKFRERRIKMDVRPSLKVRRLKTKLGNMNFELPEKYFFIHDQDLLDDEQSLISQNVADGDVIHIFEGYVS